MPAIDRGNSDNLNVSKAIKDLPVLPFVYLAHVFKYCDLSAVNVFRIAEHMARDKCSSVFCL